MNIDKIRNIVDRINDGEWKEIETFFGGFENALKLIEKAGLVDLIDPFVEELEYERNLLIYELINSKNPETSKKFFKSVVDRLGDIQEINGEYYLDLDDLKDLSELFKSYTRDTSPKDIASSILGEDDWEPFWDTTDNVYRDVVDELTPDNKKYFRDRVLKLLENNEIELDGRSSDLMEELTQEQNKETSFTVTPQNIDRIVNDEDTMLWLLKNDLHDLNSDLHSMHNNAYNDAYRTENYKKVWDELSEYIDIDSKMDWYKRGNKYRVRVRVKPDQLKSVISEMFYQYKKYNDDLLYDPGTYMGFITKLMYEGPYNYLDFRLNDYPDFRLVEKYINDNFTSYF